MDRELGKEALVSAIRDALGAGAGPREAANAGRSA